MSVNGPEIHHWW